MGSVLSTATRCIFDITSELFTAIAAGPLGIVYVTYTGIVHRHFFKTFFITTITMSSLFYFFRNTELVIPSTKKVIFISGCDSGLGFSLAQHTSDLGFTVLAGCLNLNSKGAQILKNQKRLIPLELDITDVDNVCRVVETISMYLQDGGLELFAVINNAGVMVFGEFEWLTDELIGQQIEINLFGTLRVAKAFSPLLRKYKARIITITSHCASETLPTLSVYGATKAALQAWSDGLRVEMSKYGVKVITFVPGSFISTSNIMARQNEYAYKMSAAFTPEQKIFYGDYFKRFNLYLSGLAHEKSPEKVPDAQLYQKFEQALLEVEPKPYYINEPPRYTFYHTLFKFSPTSIRDYLILKFMRMPEYRPANYVPDAIG